MRKLATAAAVSLALASSGVRALGLGDIEMRSALNQPMNAEIRLTSVKPGEATGMIVKLASPEAFARAGIERDGPLVDLRFSVDSNSSNPVIKISSQRPIVEPFLNFLLEVEWPQGRMVREYTVLLDPPVFMTPNAASRNQASDTPVTTESSDSSLLTPTPVERDTNAAVAESFEVELIGTDEELADSQTVGDNSGEIVQLDNLDENLSSEGEIVSLTDLAEPNIAAQTEVAEQNIEAQLNAIPDVEIVGSATEVPDNFTVAGEQVELAGEVVSLQELTPAESAEGSSVNVVRGDTLYEIARDNAVDGVSPEQLMLALLAANENAFINSNINLVKAGAVLRVPTASEARALSQAQALAQISEQNQLWQEYRDSVRSAASTRVAANTESAPEVVDDTEAESSGELTAAAQEVLDAARAEVESRDELKIVADSESTSTTASATADESTENDAERLGEINRKLQLAREELASSRLETEDLGDQATDLESTSEKLDALVTLRENEVAKLEDQLRLAREQADAQEATAAEVAESVAESIDTDAEATAEVETSTTAADAVASVADEETVANAAEALANAAAQSAGSDSSEESNALTAAGQELASVELIDSDSAAVEDAAATATTTTIEAPAAKRSFMDTLLGGGKGLYAIAGVGVVALLGLIGTLLFRRRNKGGDDMLDFGDEVDFIDDDEANDLQAEVETARAGTDEYVDETATGSAAVASFADSDEEFQAPAADADDDDIDKDDTISEVDVYLAYGLHGQAEELLTKAIDRDPHNQEYQYKLLETFHAQRNTEAYGAAAQKYAENFGSEGNPQWAGVANMGHDLDPQSGLYESAATAIESVGVGDYTAPKLDADDFNVEKSTDFAGSVSREFGGESAGADEPSTMDQSLDPAFAFDETDLEATGDFSQMASELSDESDTIEFPESSELTETAADKADDALDFDEALTLDEFDVGEAATAVNDEVDLDSVADDLTLDLDKLSGDMDLDSTELLDDELGSLEMPDLTSDNDLLSAGTAPAADSDEMDTMMDLAKAYIDMGDKDSASSALGEIVKSGSPAQVSEAETLLRKIS